MESTAQYKESISDRYIQDFKKDLNFFEKMMIAPISNKMKEILKSDKKIDVNSLKDLEDLGFWRKVLGVKIGDKQLFDKLTSKTYSFLKEKQEKIIQAQTEGRLDELANLVINGKLDNLEQHVDNEGGNEGDNEGGNEGDNEGGNEGDNEGGNEGDNEGGNEGDNEGGNEGDNEGGNEGDNEGGDEGDNEGGNPDEGSDKSGINPELAGVVSGIGGAELYRRSFKLAEKTGLRDMPKDFNVEDTKKLMDRIVGQLESKSKNVNLNAAQKKVYQKSIDEFKNAAGSLKGEGAEAFLKFQKFSDRLPSGLFEIEDIHVSPGVLKAISELPDEDLMQLSLKSEKEIVEFLKGKNIKVSESTAKWLKIAKNPTEVREVLVMLKGGKNLRNILRGIKGMGYLTFLFAGFDVWLYFNTKKEADLAKKVNELRGEIIQNKANAELIIGVGSVLAEALLLVAVCAGGGSIGGPLGLAIGAAIGVLTAVFTAAWDSFYEDKEFYSQNRYDFINQKRTKIKQSIVQLLESDRLDKDEKLKQSIKDDRGPKSEIDTLEDAWEALIYQEEVMKGGYPYLQEYYHSGESKETYMKKLQEYEKKQFLAEEKEMEDIINLRKEYILQYIKENKNLDEYKDTEKALIKNKGMEYVEQVLADSNVYAYLKSEDEDPYIQNYKELNVKAYKEAYKQKLSQEYSQEFAIFEKLKQENPILLQEICEGTLASRPSLESEFESDDENPCYTQDQIGTMKKNIDFVVKYNEYLNLGRPIEKKMEVGFSYDAVRYSYIQQVLMDLNSINKRPIWNKDQTCNYMACYAFNEYIDGLDSQVSDSVFQNIIYSIAKEIHGYTGNNDKLELAGFYTGDGDTTGIYMDDARRINDVTGFLFFGAKDESIENPDKLTKSQALKMIVGEVDLDSTVEVADKSLTTEFRKRVKAIIEREYSYRENKIDYEKQIIDFIKSNNEGQDGYVEIPAHIALNAKRAGIGDVHKFLFRIENGQIYALSRGDMVNTVLNFEEPNIKIKYEAVNPIRTELSDQEKKIISYVDGMEKKLDKLRGKQEQHLVWEEHEEDLDIPVELERAMSQKSIEWDKLKQSILYMDPYTALDCLAEKSKEYYDFFHGMYLGIMNRVTNMAGVDSNDLNNSANFLYATQFIGFEVASIKNNKLEISDLVNESIKEYLPGLFEGYKDGSTGKTVKELLMSKDEKEQKIGQELANKIYELCLEETVLEFDKSGNVTNISTVDFSSNDLEKVKKKIGEGLKGVGFLQASEDYKNTAVQPIEGEFTIRNVEKAEVDTHKEIKKMTDAIVNTMRNVDRGNKRGEPEFIADLEQKADGKISGALKSYKKYSEKITVNMDKSGNIKSITVDGLGMTFTNPQEGFRVANLINWIKHHVDQHPRGSSAKATGQPFKTTHGKYMWENGELQRDITNYAFDTTILEEETCKEYYPTIYKEKKFTNYVNKFNK